MTTQERKTRKPSDYPYHLEYQTRWFDNDMYAHLNNTVYPVLFDSIVNTYLVTYCGLDPFNRGGSSSSSSSSDNNNHSTGNTKSSQNAIIVSSYCDYFASVSFPDVLVLGLRVAKLGTSSVTYEIGVFRKGEDEVKVVGGYTHVFVSKETMRPVKGGMERGIRGSLETLVVDDEKGLKSKL